MNQLGNKYFRRITGILWINRILANGKKFSAPNGVFVTAYNKKKDTHSTLYRK